MKKLIYIALLMLCFAGLTPAQSIWWWAWGDDIFYTHQAVTEYNTVTSTTATIRGSITKTKSDKANGSKGADGYMRWWLDSTDVITNGTFDSDTSEWAHNGTPTTFEWVASGGGFTGAVHIVGDTISDGIVNEGGGANDIILAIGTTFKVTADVNIASLSGTNILFLIFAGGGYYLDTLKTTGLHNIIGTFKTISNGIGAELGIVIYQESIGTCEFYVDNITLTNIVDSSLGTSKTFTLSGLVEDTTYYYDFVTIPRGGNDSYSNGIDSSFTTPLSAPLISDVQFYNSSAYLTFVYNTTQNDNGVGIERDTSGGSTWVRVDTVAYGTYSYQDSANVIVGGEYKWRAVNLGSNSESDYSNTVTGTIVADEFLLTFSPSKGSYTMDSTKASASDGNILNEGFESGDLSNWSDTSNQEGNNTITVVADTTYAGSYSAYFDYNGGSGNNLNYIELDVANLETIYLSCRLRAGSINDSLSYVGYHTLIAFRDNYTDVAKCSFTSGNGVDLVWNRWRLASADGNLSGSVDSGVVYYDWVNLQMVWEKGTGADGYVTLYVDGDSIAGVSGADYSAYNVDAIRIGNYNSVVPNEESTFYIDAIRIDTLGFSGSGGSADSTVSIAFINTSGQDPIEITNMTLVDTAVFSIVDTLTYSLFIADSDTEDVEIVIDKDQNDGTYKDTITVTHDGSDNPQKIPLQVIISGATPPDVSDTTAPNPVASLEVTGYYEDATPQTYCVLNWVEENSPSGDRAGYIIYRCDATEGTCSAYSAIDSVALGTYTYTDTSASAGDTLWFYVRVYDDSSNQSWGNPSDSGIVPSSIPPDVPVAPSSLTASSDTAKSDLSWTDNADNETAYLVEKKLSSGGTYAQIDSIAANSTTYEVTGLAYNTTYNYRVRGVNGNGYGNYSNVATATTVDTNNYPKLLRYVGLWGAGDSTGTSWANMMSYQSADIGDIWTALSDSGGYLFLDGGSSGVTYTEEFHIEGTGNANNELVIRGGWDAGHDGEVTITVGNNSSGNQAIYINGGSSKKEYITISNLTVTKSTYGIFLINRDIIDGINNITFDSLTITQWGLTDGGSFQSAAILIDGGSESNDTTAHIDSIYITNCDISIIDSIDCQTDAVVARFAQNIVVDNTSIYQDNRSYAIYQVAHHNDCIQVYAPDGTGRVGVYNLTVTNCTLTNLAGIDSLLIINPVTAHGHIIMSEDIGGNYIFYNNEFRAPFFFGYGQVIMEKQQHFDSGEKYIIIHNTFVARRTLRIFELESETNPQTSSPHIIKNNIFYSDTLPNDKYQYGIPDINTDDYGTALYSGLEFGDWGQIDGNLYSTNCYRYGTDYIWSAGGSRDSAYITSNGGESSGDFANRYLVDPEFVDYTRAGYPDGTLGTYDLHLQSTSPARNEGADLQSYIEGLGLDWTDKDGVSRDSTPDCGAYQYVP